MGLSPDVEAAVEPAVALVETLVAELMLGFTQDEWLENPFLWYSQLHPDDRAAWIDEFTRGCQAGGPFRAECRYLARDGRVVWIHGEARLVRDAQGRPLFLQGVAFDITESKRAQQVLLAEAVRTARVEEELEIARRVQASILPRDVRVAGLQLAAAMVPASEVGGDYYDVLAQDDGCWLAIGDVSGHGLNAGLVMLMLQSAMAALVLARPTAAPRELVAAVNEVLHANIRTRLARDDHATFALLRYTRDGRVVFAGAHDEVLVCRRATGRVERHVSVGTWLGARRDIAPFTRDREVRLHDGDLLVLYTDGLIEAMNTASEQWDIVRLCATLEAVRELPPAQIIERVLAAVRAWTTLQDDDITLLVARYQAPEASAPGA